MLDRLVIQLSFLTKYVSSRFLKEQNGFLSIKFNYGKFIGGY